MAVYIRLRTLPAVPSNEDFPTHPKLENYFAGPKISCSAPTIRQPTLTIYEMESSSASNPVEVIGGGNNFWLHSKNADGGDHYDLTHPTEPSAPPVSPRLQLEVTGGSVDVDPSKTTLVIFDLQNFFVSPALGRPSDAPTLDIVQRLVTKVIPACRKAQIPVVWLGWGFPEQDIDNMPPTRFSALPDPGTGIPHIYDNVGREIGEVELADGTKVDGGRVLMRDQWNTQLYPPLLEAVDEENDIWIYMNRPFNPRSTSPDMREQLQARGLRTLLLAGGESDQGLVGSIRDALKQGWDRLLLSDGCSTSDPDMAQMCIEQCADVGRGFHLSCEQFSEGVEKL